MKTLVTLWAIFVFPIVGNSTTIHVPDDYTTIQGAIALASVSLLPTLSPRLRAVSMSDLG